MDKTNIYTTSLHVKFFEVRELNPCSVEVKLHFTKKRYLRERFLIRHERGERVTHQTCYNLGSWSCTFSCVQILFEGNPPWQEERWLYCMYFMLVWIKERYCCVYIYIYTYIHTHTYIYIILGSLFPFFFFSSFCTCVIGLRLGKKKPCYLCHLFLLSRC